MITDLDRKDAHSAFDIAPAQQARTYHGFLIGLRYIVLAQVVLGTVLILGFCTSTPLIGAFVIGAIELAIGLYFARDRDRDTLEWPSQVATLVMTTAAESGQHARLSARDRFDAHGLHPAE